jgi:colicin import membrane protein
MSRRFLLYPLACVICLALLAPVGLQAADKPSKEEKDAARRQQQAERERRTQEKAAERQRSAKSKDTSNPSVKTQRKTADAFAADREKKSEKPEESEPLTGTDKELADLDKQLKDEDARHAAALKSLRKQEQSAAKSRDPKKIEAAKLAIAKENETYQKKRAALEERRREVMERANPKPAAEKPTIASPGRSSDPAARNSP